MQPVRLQLRVNGAVLHQFEQSRTFILSSWLSQRNEQRIGPISHRPSHYKHLSVSAPAKKVVWVAYTN